MASPSVLIIRKEGRFDSILREAGLEVSNLELIRTEPLAELAELDERIAELDRYDGLFFTSPAAVEVFVERLDASGTTARPKAYVLGDRARAVIEPTGFETISDPEANTAEELIDSLGNDEFYGKRLLFVRGTKTVGTISRLLSRGAELDEVLVYRTVEATPDAPAIDAARGRLNKGEIDWVCFFSPSAVERFHELFSTSTASAAVIGSTTAAAAERFEMNLQFESSRANAEDFATELVEHIKRID